MDNITFLLALWGAILSTILGIRELRRDRRSLKILLEFVRWMERYRVVIINIGHRPITIDQINLSVIDRKTKHPIEAIPQSEFWFRDEKHKPPELPLILEDGRMAVFYLASEISDQLWFVDKYPPRYLDIRVFDAEGNVYSKYSKSEYDLKYGYRVRKKH